MFRSLCSLFAKHPYVRPEVVKRVKLITSVLNELNASGVIQNVTIQDTHPATFDFEYNDQAFQLNPFTEDSLRKFIERLDKSDLDKLGLTKKATLYKEGLLATETTCCVM